MKTHTRFYTVAVLLLLPGTVHAQLTETMPSVFVDLDNVHVTPKMKWFADSLCIVIELREHKALLKTYQKMPDYYFSKRLKHQYTTEELPSYEKEMVAVSNNKFALYKKKYEAALASK